MAAQIRAPGRADRWTQRDAWLIAYPDQFAGPGRPLQALDAVVGALGPPINGVHVLPFHPSSSDGGFSVIDYAAVDPAHGDWDDVAALARGHRLMADAVINHVSAQGVWFREYLAGAPSRQSFFRTVPEGTDLSAVVRPRAGPPLARVEHVSGPRDVWATFGTDQIDLDYRDPEVLLAVFEAIFCLVANGADAVRLDAVAFLWKDPEGPSIHLAETHTTVALLRSCLDEIDPSVMLVTETNVEHRDNVAYLGTAEEPEAHAIYQFSLAPLVLHAVVTGDAGPLVAWAKTTQQRPETTVLNFLASHDGVGLRPAVGWLAAADIANLVERCEAVGGAANVAATAAGTEPYELAATWWSLCGGGDDEATLHRHLASHAVAFALAGIPLVYVHSLVGSDNDTVTAATTGISRDLNRARFADGEAFVNALSGDGRAGRVWTGLSEMLAWRQAHPAFHPDARQRVEGDGRGLVTIERECPAGRALVAVNFGDEAARVPLPSPGWVGFDGSLPAGTSLEVSPRGSRWVHDGHAPV